MSTVGDLVQSKTGWWITHPPTRCPNGHRVGAGAIRQAAATLGSICSPRRGTISRTHKRNRWAHPRRGRVQRRIISVPNRGRSISHFHVTLPLVGGVPGVADVPIPIHLVIHPIKHILRIPLAPAG